MPNSSPQTSHFAEAPGVSFVYVSRWSIPADWPQGEPPIPTDETLIPKGTRDDEMLSLMFVDAECEVCDKKLGLTQLN